MLTWSGVQARMLRPDLSQEFCHTPLGIPKDSEIVFADLARAGVAHSYLAVLVTRGADGSTSACRWRVNGAADGASYTMTKPRWDPLLPPGGAEGDQSSSTAALLTCALHPPAHDSAAQPTLSVVWDSLVWQRLRVGTGSAPILETSFHVSGVGTKASHRPAGTARGKAASTSSSSGTVAASIHSDYLLLIGRSAGDRAGAAQGKDSGRDSSAFNSMAAWDALYGTKQGAGELRWASEDGDLAHYAADAVTAARASEDGSLVAIALQKCVVVCSVQSSAMSLQMVVAAAASTREKSLAQPSAAMRPVDVLACIAMADDGREQDKEGATGEAVVAEGPRTRLAQAVQEGNRRESAILQQICAETKGNNWVEAVKLYLEDLQAESANTEAARRTSKAQPAARARRGGGTAREGGGSGRAPMRVAVSEEVLDAVMRRCSEKGADGKFDEALLALVQAGAVTMRAHTSLLPYAIESGNLVLLESIFKFVPDLLEEHLVAGLKLILLSIRKHSMDTFITTWAAASPETPVLDHDAVRRHLLGARVCACCCVLAASWRAPARARAA